MRKNRTELIWVGIALAIVSGCKTQPETVYVDLDRVAITASNVLHATAAPVPPKGQTASTATLPGAPGRDFLLDSRPQLDRAQGLIDQDLKQARRGLVRQYTIERNADIDELHQKQLRSLKPLADQLREQVGLEIRAKFEAYARVRGPKLSRLTALQAIIPRDRLSEDARRDAVELANLKGEIAKLDAAYVQERLTLQAKVQTGVDVALTKIQTDISLLRVQANDEAAVAAEKQLADTKVSLPAPQSVRVQLSPLPARQTVIPGAPGPSAPPKISGSLRSDDVKTQRDLATEQAQIWAGTSGYRLQSTPGGVRDATAEFVQWIKDRKAGH